MLPLPILHAPGSQAQELGAAEGKSWHVPCTSPPTQSPLTHYVAVVSLSHEQHAANKVSGGHALSAFAFPAGDKQRMKQKPQDRTPLSAHVTTGTPVTPDKSRDCPKETSLSTTAFIC